MKVAFVFHPWDSTEGGGAPGIWNYQVTRRLARSEKVIVYAHLFGNQKRIECLEGVEYRRFPIGLLDRASRKYPGLFFPRRGLKRPLFFSYPYYLGYALKVAFDLRKRNCDVVHVHSCSHFVPIIKSLNPGIRIVLHIHGEELTQVEKRMVERKLRKVDSIIGCSEFVSAKIRRFYPWLEGRCQAIPMGVDPDHFCSGGNSSERGVDGVKRLLYVGRISPEKGLHILLDALKTVIKQHPRTQLDVVGEDWVWPTDWLVDLCEDPKVSDLKKFYMGSYRSHIEGLLSPALLKHVGFRGYVPHEQVVGYLQTADVYISPSFYESLGMATIEAMASGVPVVATPVGGVPEVVEDGKTGLMVPSGNPEALSEAILRLFADEELRSSLAKAGRRKAIELFSWDRICENLLSLYKDICVN